MKIIITGSLGHIGNPLTKTLVGAGHAVTVISSKEAKKKEIEALGATAAIGTLEDLFFLTKTFAHADALFAMMPPNFAETNQVAYYRRLAQNFVNASATSTIKHIVHLSSYGAHLEKDSGFILGAHHAEGILQTLPHVAVTHLRAGYFYYNLNAFKAMLQTSGNIGSNYGGNDPMLLVDPIDIAAAAAEELQKQPPPGHTVRYVASDYRTADEIAAVLGAALGKPNAKWLLFSSEQAKAAMLANGMPKHLADNFVELGEGIHNGKLLADYETQPPVGMGMIKLEDFAKTFAAASANAH